MSSTPFDIPATIKRINTTSNDLGKDTTGAARRQCLDAVRLLSFALETPVESILRYAWAEVRPSVPYPLMFSHTEYWMPFSKPFSKGTVLHYVLVSA